MSSTRPRNGETKVAPILAARIACAGEKTRVTLMGMPAWTRRAPALTPARVIGTLTTTLSAIAARSWPWPTISSTVSARHLGGHRTGDQVGDQLDEIGEVEALLGGQRRVGRDAVEDAPTLGGLEVGQVGRVEEQLQRCLQ